jgi:hypothetical protein
MVQQPGETRGGAQFPGQAPCRRAQSSACRK